MNTVNNKAVCAVEISGKENIATKSEGTHICKLISTRNKTIFFKVTCLQKDNESTGEYSCIKKIGGDKAEIQGNQNRNIVSKSA